MYHLKDFILKLNSFTQQDLNGITLTNSYDSGEAKRVGLVNTFLLNTLINQLNILFDK